MVTLKELEAYIKVKDYIEENNLKIEDLLESFNTECVHVTVESNVVSKKFYSLASVTHYIHPSVTGPLKALPPLFFQTPKKFCMPPHV